jgi:hypothetical protein
VKRFVVGTLILALLVGFYSYVPIPKTGALSSDMLIYQLQTAGALSGTASQELILLLNSSSQAVDVTNWCMQYTSSTDSGGFKKCIVAPDTNTQVWVSSGGLISFATAEFIAVNPGFIPDVTYSAGVAATGGHIRLLNALGQEVDKVGWGGATSPETTATLAHTVGSVLSRSLVLPAIDTDNNSIDFVSNQRLQSIVSGLYEVVIPVDVCANIDGVQESIPDGYMIDVDGGCYFDVCPNLDELQQTMPVGYQMDGLMCVEIPLESRPLLITELFPNAPSYDTGLEFIEIYNPNNTAIPLIGYGLQIGTDLVNDYVFTEGSIEPGAYLAFSDAQTGIVLPNSTGVAVRLVSPAGGTVSEVPAYVPNIEEDSSWSIIEDQWIVTNQVTRGSANKPFLQTVLDDEEVPITTVFAPCPAGKYRNPETNRCRTIETAISTLLPCDEDEYRNPETNRCRKLMTTTSTLQPCDADEERNPITNRCRKISTTSSDLKPCAEGQERNPETNRCRKITNAVLASSENAVPEIVDEQVNLTESKINWPVLGFTSSSTLGYMLYEWRNELRAYLKRRK